jgi:site-specific DNA-methyltransferase (adenine-specific)
MSGKLYFGDNRYVIAEHIEPNSVDLVYLDPPFNSKAQYNILYETRGNQRERAQQTIFRDMWSWEEEETQASYRAVLAHGGQVASIVEALTLALKRSDLMAYIAMMAARLVKIHNVLKPTGSLYLHCDPAASHYIKLILDALFGSKNFRNEIIWKRSSAHNSAKRWGPIHDVLLFYTVSDEYTWNRVFSDYDEDYLTSKYRHSDDRGTYRLSDLTGAGTRSGDSGKPWRAIDPTSYGRHWAVPADRAIPKWFQFPLGWAALSTQERLDLLADQQLIRWPTKTGARPEFKRYRETAPGQPLQDIITDIDPVNSMAKERIGFPTQKPTPRLERIIKASSNEGDVILDPFCGCGTSVLAAQSTKREWVGIDISYYSVRLVQRRLIANFGHDCVIPIAGIPADLASAEALAENQPYGFQQWAVGELGCQLWNEGKKGADGGIDGEMWFYNPPHGAGRLLVQVKGGRRIGAAAVREFITVLDREKAQLGVFFSRTEPTPEMRREATRLDDVRVGGKAFRRLQFCWLSQWFSGIRPDLPVPIAMEVAGDRSAAKRARRPDPRQPQFTFVIEGDVTPTKKGQVLNPAMIPEAALKAS